MKCKNLFNNTYMKKYTNTFVFNEFKYIILEFSIIILYYDLWGWISAIEMIIRTKYNL